MLLYFGLPLIAFVLLAALILGIWIERPIRTLSKTMAGISRTGDLSSRVAVGGGGEIASMSLTFNKMIEQLSRQREELLTFRTMILAMKEEVLIEDAGQQVVYMNPRMEELLGVRYEPPRPEEEPLKLANRITLKRQVMEDERGFATEEVEWYQPDGSRIQALKTSGRLECTTGQITGILDLCGYHGTERIGTGTHPGFAHGVSRDLFPGDDPQLEWPVKYHHGILFPLARNHPDSEIPGRIHADAQKMAELITSLGRRWRRTGEVRLEQLDLNEIIQEELSFLDADLFSSIMWTKPSNWIPNCRISGECMVISATPF